jgi:biopolymer transport protein TolR
VRCGALPQAGIVMAFGRLERREGPQPFSDINVTPLVDVMLVLVVIFIITAPLMASSIRLGRPILPGRPAAHTR